MSCQDMPWGASCCEYDGTTFTLFGCERQAVGRGVGS